MRRETTIKDSNPKREGSIIRTMPVKQSFNAEREVYSVSRLNREARNMLENGFRTTWVEGEISNLARPASGHLYFTLKDKQAQVRCALFRNRIQRRFVPENGSQVILQAQVSLYENRGDYQLIVEQVEEAGDGALRRAFEQLKANLSDEGLFDERHKQPLPEIPRCIGVITSSSGAAIRDVLTVLKRRFAGIPVILYPCAVQGNEAPAQIVRALNLAEDRNECDVVLLTRGGGSLEDLQAFNDESVARAVFNCPLPIISAVGHEVDIVITDFIADQRAATPSAAAELLSPSKAALQDHINQLQRRLVACLQQQTRLGASRLHGLNSRLQQQQPGKRLQRQSQHLDDLEQRLFRSWMLTLSEKNAHLQRFQSRLAQLNPKYRLATFSNELQQLKHRLVQAMQLQNATLRTRLSAASGTLHAVSPLATLQRGYSLTRIKNHAELVNNSDSVQINDQIETRLANGRLTSIVTEITK